MQAYVSAHLTPLESESQPAPVQSVRPVAGGPAGNAVAALPLETSSPVAALVSAIVDGLSDGDLVVLARRLLPHLRQPTEPSDGHSAYTVASLAAELGVSQKTIRCAIARRDLAAVKRGARWLISAEAVREWATPSEARARPRRTRGAAVPKAAGPSLRAVLCTSASSGARR
ncbi:MAG: helix-turn-helix domain-containing protein [Solirubrobacterales bacterium]|nr:helix-turn-helix domain-containing protein [Solirubrobacterales bacterium]MBV9940946.1 helix-turn-helix domain-containing protein [Solirubrobacterales bacterium]